MPHQITPPPPKRKEEPCNHQWWKDSNPEGCLNCGKTRKQVYDDNLLGRQRKAKEIKVKPVDWDKPLTKAFQRMIINNLEFKSKFLK